VYREPPSLIGVWAKRVLGVDFFDRVTAIEVRRSRDAAELGLEEFTNLKSIWVPTYQVKEIVAAIELEFDVIERRDEFFTKLVLK